MAVKVLNGKNQYEEECAKREIDIQKTLSHPNCLKIYGVSHDPENKTCLIVPYAEGVLQDIIEEVFFLWHSHSQLHLRPEEADPDRDRHGHCLSPLAGLRAPRHQGCVGLLL